MSFCLEPTIDCDHPGCERTFRVDWRYVPNATGRTAHDATEIRKLAGAEGWRRGKLIPGRAGRPDYCPDHNHPRKRSVEKDPPAPCVSSPVG